MALAVAMLSQRTHITNMQAYTRDKNTGTSNLVLILFYMIIANPKNSVFFKFACICVIA